MTAPTRCGAERAAKALARVDAAQVLLFGSVAGVQGITDVSETIAVNATDPRRLGLIQSLRRDPDFAVGTYARRSLTPPPTALPQAGAAPDRHAGPVATDVPGPAREPGSQRFRKRLSRAPLSDRLQENQVSECRTSKMRIAGLVAAASGTNRRGR